MVPLPTPLSEEMQAFRLFYKYYPHLLTCNTKKSSPSYFSDELLIKVFKNLPKRSAAILQETVEHLDLMRESEMTEAQEKVLMIISDLENRGEILVSN